MRKQILTVKIEIETKNGEIIRGYLLNTFIAKSLTDEEVRSYLDNYLINSKRSKILMYSRLWKKEYDAIFWEDIQGVIYY